MSLAARLFGGEVKAGPWGGPLGTLIESYLRDEDLPTYVSNDTAMRVAAVSACVRLISQTVGSLPLHVYHRVGDGRERALPTHSLERVLQRPNGWQTSMEFREQLMASVLMRGNGYAWINWVKGAVHDADGRLEWRDQVAELIPLDPNAVEVRRKAWKAAPTYLLWLEDGQKLPLPAEEILHIRGLSFNGAAGRGVIQDARESVSVAINTQTYARRFWKNDATPGVVISTDQVLTRPQAEELADQWDSRHGGSQEARRTAVLGKGAKVEKLALTAEDSQFLETRKFQRAEIAGLFMVPPHLIGDVDRSTSWGSGIEQQQIAFLVYTIRPWLVRWEQAIRRCLILREDDYYVEHNVAGVQRGDLRSQSASFATGINWGWWSPNDVRRMLNENPRPGGDVYLTPSNMTTRPGTMADGVKVEGAGTDD